MKSTTIKEDNCSRILRIKLVHSPKDFLLVNRNLKFQIVLVTEFCDIVENVIDSYNFYCKWSDSSNSDSSNITSSAVCEFTLLNCVYKSSVAIATIVTPSNAGTYDLHISYVSKKSVSATSISSSIDLGSYTTCHTKNVDIVLPIIYKSIACVTNDDEIVKSNYLLSCYRMFNDNITKKSVIIQEDYGATLGSHIYDGSIVMLKYFMQEQQQLLDEADDTSSITSIVASNDMPRDDIFHNSQSSLSLSQDIECQSNDNDNDNGYVIELGSGCGLLGIWLGLNSSRYSKVYLTDKLNQLDIINRNIKLNVTDCVGNSNSTNDIIRGKCIAKELDWSDDKVSGLNDIIPTSNQTSNRSDNFITFIGKIIVPSLIIASDVLYDKSLAITFFTMLLKLCINKESKVILAQKHRGDSSILKNILHDSDVIAYTNNFSFSLISTEYNVTLYMLSLKS